MGRRVETYLQVFEVQVHHAPNAQQGWVDASAHCVSQHTEHVEFGGGGEGREEEEGGGRGSLGDGLVCVRVLGCLVVRTGASDKLALVDPPP